MGLKDLKGLFFETKEDKSISSKGNQVKSTDSNKGVPINTPMPTSSSDEIKKVLMDSLNEKSVEGFNYIKFKQSLDSMKTVIADEKTRFASTFTTAKPFGATKDKLISTAKLSLTSLDSEKKDFDNEMKSQTNAKVTLLQSQMVELAKSIEDKTITMAKLSEEISSLQKQKIELDAKVQENQNLIDHTIANFNATHTALQAEISSDINKIENYLEG